MSDAMFLDFTNYALKLSYEQTLTLMKTLLENLKNKASFEKVEEQEEKIPDFLLNMFSICDSNPKLHKSESKWTREELYER